MPAGRLRDLDVSTVTDVFAGLATYANFPYVHCLSADPASVDKYNDGRVVRPLFVFEAPRQVRSLWPCNGSTRQSGHQSLPLYQSLWSVSNWQCEYSVGEDVPDECRFAGGIDKNEWDSDECLRPGRPQSNPASGSTPDGPGPIQGRRQTLRFEHEDFMGRSNGFKKTQAWSRCEQSGHNAKTCKIELVDRACG